MSLLVKSFNDGSIVEFDKGNFDDWCVYLTRKGNQRYAPSDVQYFNELGEFGNIYGHQRIYDDFLKIFNPTDAAINPKILKEITRIADTYGENSAIIDIWFTVIYAGMIAEENKQNMILKKRVKRLGMYQVLIERKPADYAAKFSKGKKWRELDGIMSALGF